jgi:hypothetical protein
MIIIYDGVMQNNNEKPVLEISALNEVILKFVRIYDVY